MRIRGCRAKETPHDQEYHYQHLRMDSGRRNGNVFPGSAFVLHQLTAQHRLVVAGFAAWGVRSIAIKPSMLALSNLKWGARSSERNGLVY